MKKFYELRDNGFGVKDIAGFMKSPDGTTVTLKAYDKISYPYEVIITNNTHSLTVVIGKWDRTGVVANFNVDKLKTALFLLDLEPFKVDGGRFEVSKSRSGMRLTEL